MPACNSIGTLTEEEAVLLVTVAFRQVVSGRKGQDPEVKQDDSKWRFSRRWWNEPVAFRGERRR